MEMANDRIGDAVPPRSFRGEAMNKNSYTPSFDKSSNHNASMIESPRSTSKHWKN